MTMKIIEEWSEYCGNMGSVVTRIGNVTISKNTGTTIACDFTNCLISLNTNMASLEDFKDNFKGRSFKIYSVLDLDKVADTNVKSDRKASLMVIGKETWLNKYSNITEKSTPNALNYSIISLADEDLVDFGNVVFEAFNYDKTTLQQSINLYLNGLKSGKIHYYGLKLEAQIVSCALLHNNTAKDIAGLQLVSTRPKYQHLGLSKILVLNLLRENFSQDTEVIWLFAIEGSIAERYYSALGFKKMANIFIKTVNEG